MTSNHITTRTTVQFSSVQFSSVYSIPPINYKSKRPTGYGTGHSTIYICRTLMHKDSIYKVTIIIQAGNKMALVYGYLTD